MTRTSKQGRLRRISKRRPSPPAPKTGPKKEKHGFRSHLNTIPAELAASRFFPKFSQREHS